MRLHYGSWKSFKLYRRKFGRVAGFVVKLLGRFLASAQRARFLENLHPLLLEHRHSNPVEQRLTNVSWGLARMERRPCDVRPRRLAVRDYRPWRGPHGGGGPRHGRLGRRLSTFLPESGGPAEVSDGDGVLKQQ